MGQGQYSNADLASDIEMWPSHQPTSGQYSIDDIAPTEQPQSWLARKWQQGQDIAAHMHQAMESRGIPAVTPDAAARAMQLGGGFAAGSGRFRNEPTPRPTAQPQVAPQPEPTAEAEGKVPGEAPRTLGNELPRTLSGESALNGLLSGLDSRTLIKIAKSRGLDTSVESTLRPALAEPRLIRKIINDFDPQELQNVRDSYLEISRLNSTPWQGIGPEDWRTLTLEQFFPSVSIPRAQVMRLQKRADALRVQGMR